MRNLGGWQSTSLHNAPRNVQTMTKDSSLEDEISALERQHARLESRIEALNQHRWLSEREQTERKRLQKLKLATKTRIASLRVQAN